jgi:hypothetical protein
MAGRNARHIKFILKTIIKSQDILDADYLNKNAKRAIELVVLPCKEVIEEYEAGNVNVDEDWLRKLMFVCNGLEHILKNRLEAILKEYGSYENLPESEYELERELNVLIVKSKTILSKHGL